MATTGANRVFVDTNFLASALLANSPRYFQARGSLRRLALAQTEVWISRQVIREFLATMMRYESLWQGFRRDAVLEAGRHLESHFFIAEDLPSVSEKLYLLLGQGAPAPLGSQIHDATIAATMMAHDIRVLLTYNQADYQRFAGFIDTVDNI